MGLVESELPSADAEKHKRLNINDIGSVRMLIRLQYIYNICQSTRLDGKFQSDFRFMLMIAIE